MRPNYHLSIFQVSILAALFLMLEADTASLLQLLLYFHFANDTQRNVCFNFKYTPREDSDCDTDLKVERGTVYEAVTGEDLRINCIVAFCDNSPPTVTWYKREKSDVPVDVSSRIKTKWELVNDSEGISFLIFQKIFRNDSGDYLCQSGDIVSHNINVSVHDAELTTGTWTTLEPESPAAQDTFWPFVYRVVGIMAFVNIVVAIYVGSRCGCKGASRDTRGVNRQPSRDV